MSLNTVQAWEKGSMPRPKVGHKLAEVFGVEPLQLTDELVSYKNSQATAKPPPYGHFPEEEDTESGKPLVRWQDF